MHPGAPLAVLLALLAIAPPSAAAKLAATDPYYRVAPKHGYKGDTLVIHREAFNLLPEVGDKDALCLVPPLADWLLDTNDPALPVSYLELMDTVADSAKENWSAGFIMGLDEMFVEYCTHKRRALYPGPFSNRGKRTAGVEFIIVETLKRLSDSLDPKVNRKAIAVMGKYKDGPKHFQAEIERALQSNVDPLLQVQAMDTLIRLQPRPETARRFVPYWKDVYPEKVRIAALLGVGDIVAQGYGPDLADLMSKMRDVMKAEPDPSVRQAADDAYHRYPVRLRENLERQ